MAVGLPPPPVNDQPGSFTWMEWYRQLRNYVSTSGSDSVTILQATARNWLALETTHMSDLMKHR